jgi:hypothetical protein
MSSVVHGRSAGTQRRTYRRDMTKPGSAAGNPLVDAW